MVISDMVMNGKGFGRKRLLRNLRYYSGLCLEGLRKTMKNLNQHSHRDLPNTKQGC